MSIHHGSVHICEMQGRVEMIVWCDPSNSECQLPQSNSSYKIFFRAAESYISRENTWFLLNWCGSVHDSYEILSPSCSHYLQWQGISKPEGKPTATANQDQTNFPHYIGRSQLPHNWEPPPICMARKYKRYFLLSTVRVRWIFKREDKV